MTAPPLPLQRGVSTEQSEQPAKQTHVQPAHDPTCRGLLVHGNHSFKDDNAYRRWHGTVFCPLCLFLSHRMPLREAAAQPKPGSQEWAGAPTAPRATPSDALTVTPDVLCMKEASCGLPLSQPFLQDEPSICIENQVHQKHLRAPHKKVGEHMGVTFTRTLRENVHPATVPKSAICLLTHWFGPSHCHLTHVD